ncbi:MAG: META domain-containing protein [Dehalococcoidales bacterium]|nr:META domain-containing protein [Dehalococcoidales bacterium]
MKKKHAIITIILGTIVTLVATGCTRGVSEADYNRVVEERDQALSQIASLEGELSTAKEHIVFLQQKIAINFVKNSPNFIFDGIENTLKLVDSEELEDTITRIYNYEFQSRHAGYGDRTGQMLLQVITPHEAVIMIFNGEIISAVIDEKWDMINQKMLEQAVTEEQAEQTAINFVKNSPTFVFDGIENTLELVETLYPDIENAWQFVYDFDSQHTGYGDRTGQMLAQVITPHQAIITVEKGQVISAIMDEKWDMLKQGMINELEDITWVMTAYTDETGTVEALEDVEVTIIFDGTEKQLSGIAGCNQYGAPYEIDGSNLTVTDSIIRTEMFCGDEIMEQEEYYLKALEEAEGYEVNGNKMTITGSGWILEFEKQQ